MNAALGGMMVAQSSFDSAAQRIAGAYQPTRSTQPQDSVDISTEAVTLLAAKNQFQANARVFQVGDKMQKKLLDMMA